MVEVQKHLFGAKYAAKRSFSNFFSSDLFIVFLLILVGFGSFGLGRLSAVEGDKTGVVIEYGGNPSTSNTVAATSILADKSGGSVVGSKNGSKYHFPWCSGATRMKEENKVWFATIEDAKKAGYTPAGNCKGLE